MKLETEKTEGEVKLEPGETEGEVKLETEELESKGKYNHRTALIIMKEKQHSGETGQPEVVKLGLMGICLEVSNLKIENYIGFYY